MEIWTHSTCVCNTPNFISFPKSWKIVWWSLCICMMGRYQLWHSRSYPLGDDVDDHSSIGNGSDSNNIVSVHKSVPLPFVFVICCRRCWIMMHYLWKFGSLDGQKLQHVRIWRCNNIRVWVQETCSPRHPLLDLTFKLQDCTQGWRLISQTCSSFLWNRQDLAGKWCHINTTISFFILWTIPSIHSSLSTNKIT